MDTQPNFMSPAAWKRVAISLLAASLLGSTAKLPAISASSTFDNPLAPAASSQTNDQQVVPRFGAVRVLDEIPPIVNLAVDASNPSAVRDFVSAYFPSFWGVPVEGTGNPKANPPIPGTISPRYIDAVRTQIDFLRALVGVDAATEICTQENAYAQAAATYLSREGRLTHELDPAKYPHEAVWGAENSSLSNRLAPKGVFSLYIDERVQNLGHRWHIILPAHKKCGVGAAGGYAYLMQVLAISSGGSCSNPLQQVPTRDGFAAAPFPGYNPDFLNTQYWLFSPFDPAISSSAIVDTARVELIDSSGVVTYPEISFRENGYAASLAWKVPNSLFSAYKNGSPIKVRVKSVEIGKQLKDYEYVVRHLDTGFDWLYYDIDEEQWAKARPRIESTHRHPEGIKLVVVGPRGRNVEICAGTGPHNSEHVIGQCQLTGARTSILVPLQETGPSAFFRLRMATR